MIRPETMEATGYVVNKADVLVGGKPLLGMNFFLDLSFRLSIGKDSGKLETDVTLPKNVKAKPLLRNKSDEILVEFSAGDQTAYAMFDTGASVTVVDLKVIQADPSKL